MCTNKTGIINAFVRDVNLWSISEAMCMLNFSLLSLATLSPLPPTEAHDITTAHMHSPRLSQLLSGCTKDGSDDALLGPVLGVVLYSSDRIQHQFVGCECCDTKRKRQNGVTLTIAHVRASVCTRHL